MRALTVLGIIMILGVLALIVHTTVAFAAKTALSITPTDAE